MKKKLLIIMMVMFMLCACTSNNTNTDTGVKDTITFKDDLDREVSVANPKRVATLLGSFAHIWTLAGGEVIAAADDAWQDFDIEMREDAVNLGHTKRLNLEQLMGAKPDFIIATTNTRINMEWKDTLEKTGIPTAYFDVNDFDDYLHMLDICTDITGRKDLYKKNGLDVQKEIQKVLKDSEKRNNTEGAKKILSLRASAANVRAKNSQDNVLGEMLKSLGCINIADKEESLLENINVEYILQEDPDYIFFVQQGDDKEGIKANIDRFMKENVAWSKLTAVKEGRVYIMDKSLYSLKPNNRWGEAYKKLEELLSEKE